jgi:PhnB protein
MTLVNVYLTFNGNCEEAFKFYKSVFGGDFAYIGRFKEMPPQDGKTVTGADGEKIMHVSLPISKETMLMGSDTAPGFGPPITEGNNFSISVSVNSKADADKYFKALSANGKVTMPIIDTFWGSYFGMCTDKFGINWMVSFDQSPNK